METKIFSYSNEAMPQPQQQVQQQQEEQEGRFGSKTSTAAPAGQKFKTLHKNLMPKNAQSDNNPMQLQCARHEQNHKQKQTKRKRSSDKGKQKSQKKQKTPTASTEVVAVESPAPKELTKDEIMQRQVVDV
jgi:hypothetical protein